MFGTSQNEIAEAVGVSRATVSYVLAGKAKDNHISDAVVQRVRQAAEEANYRPHGLARSLSSRRTGQIGILMRNAADRPFVNPPSMEFLVGINLRLELTGLVSVFVRVGDVRSEGEPPSRVFSEHMLDGIIAMGMFDQALVQRLKRLSRFCVWLDSSVYEDRCCIRRDEVEAGRQAARMAIDAGYRELIWNGPPNRGVAHYSVPDRRKGLYQEAERAGAIVREIQSESDFNRESQQAIIPHLRPEVAWVAYNTFSASRLSHIASVLGLRTGMDFGLVCCDDWEESRVTWPELSRVCFDRLGMGLAAADMLTHWLSNPDGKCPSQNWSSEIHRGATLIGPTFHQHGPDECQRRLLERIADPAVTPSRERIKAATTSSIQGASPQSDTECFGKSTP